MTRLTNIVVEGLVGWWAEVLEAVCWFVGVCVCREEWMEIGKPFSDFVRMYV